MTTKSTVEFTTAQQNAVAIVCNHVEGRFAVSPEDVAEAIAHLNSLWQEMASANRTKQATGH